MLACVPLCIMYDCVHQRVSVWMPFFYLLKVFFSALSISLLQQWICFIASYYIIVTKHKCNVIWCVNYSCVTGITASKNKWTFTGSWCLLRLSQCTLYRILSTQSELLQRLGKSLPFEIAVGLNGRIWVNGRSTDETLTLAHAISGAELLDKEQVKHMVRKLSDSLCGI